MFLPCVGSGEYTVQLFVHAVNNSLRLSDLFSGIFGSVLYTALQFRASGLLYFSPSFSLWNQNGPKFGNSSCMVSIQYVNLFFLVIIHATEKKLRGWQIHLDSLFLTLNLAKRNMLINLYSTQLFSSIFLSPPRSI